MGRYLIKMALGTAINIKSLICIGLCLTHSTIYAAGGKASQYFDGISKQFSGNADTKHLPLGTLLPLIIGGAVVVFVAWLAFHLLTRRQKMAAPDSAWGLYKKLCREHGLSGKEQRVIRKVSHLNGLEDPLPLFVEPNYFRQVLADESMRGIHAIVENLLEKLFGSDQVLPQQAIGPMTLEENNPIEIQPDLCKQLESPVVVPEATLAVSPLELPDRCGDNVPQAMEQEKQTVLDPGSTKVLLHPIPGRTAFTSLAEPVSRLSSEIAASAIQHSLTDGRGMNERTFDGFGELQSIDPEPQTLRFPKPNVPSPGEMLTAETRRSTIPVSPTPQYLRIHKENSRGGSARNAAFPKSGESLSRGDVMLMETIVTRK